MMRDTNFKSYKVVIDKPYTNASPTIYYHRYTVNSFNEAYEQLVDKDKYVLTIKYDNYYLECDKLFTVKLDEDEHIALVELMIYTHPDCDTTVVPNRIRQGD